MRLGKEQATGYIEDTEVDAIQPQERTTAQADEMPPVPAAEPWLTVS